MMPMLLITISQVCSLIVIADRNFTFNFITTVIGVSENYAAVVLLLGPKHQTGFLLILHM